MPRRRRLICRVLALLAIAATAARCVGADASPTSEPVSPPASISTYPIESSPEPPAQGPPALIFFPPVPPPLDVAVAHAPRSSRDRPAPPPELAAWVNETFYAPLGNRLAADELGNKLRRRLDAYRAMRDDLRRELEVELARVRLADADTRRQALTALAVRQAPRLAELEKTAEELRADLVDGYYDWFARRLWHLGGGSPRGDFPEEVAATIRAYGIYRRGLLPAQRGLLREISMEMSVAGEDTEAATVAQPYFFFSPEMARVHLVDDLPPPIAARVAEYQTKKSALKKELYDAVYEQERASFLRGNVLKAEVSGQAARLAELEKLAEEIRRGLASLPSPVRAIARSPLSPVLTERVAAIVRRRTALLAETQAKIDEVDRQMPASYPFVAMDYAFGASGLKFEVNPRPRQLQGRGLPTKEIQRQVGEIRLAMAGIATEYGGRLAGIANEMLAVRGDIAATPVATAGVAPEAVLAATVRYATLEENRAANRDYRTAVFEPGLSPEQRRLLFGSALAALDLPLPAGELQPTTRKK